MKRSCAPVLPLRDAEFRRLAEDGHSPSEIAAHFGVEAICATRYARGHGIVLKKQRERAIEAFDSKDALRRELIRRFEYRAADGRLVHRVGRQRGRPAGYPNSNGYTGLVVGGRHVVAHRLVWLMAHGTLPEALDHINGVRSDNRLENLRAATQAQNACNVTVVYGATPFKGVTLHKQTGKFQAQITKDRRTRYLGLFATASEAGAAYDAEAVNLFGEFACTNAELRA